MATAIYLGLLTLAVCLDKGEKIDYGSLSAMIVGAAFFAIIYDIITLLK